MTLQGFGAVGVEDLTNIDIVINPMFREGTYPERTRSMLDSLADPLRRCMPEAAR